MLMGLSLSAIMANTDKYRLVLRGNPSTTMTIAWNQISGSNPVVYYGTTDFGTNYSAYPMSKTVDRSVSYAGMSNQFARLTGLQPNTAYYFVIRDSQGTSQRFWFKTAPATSADRLSFIAGGDSRNNRTPRQNANRIVSKLRPHAVLFGGDMTSSGTNSEWQDWFDDWQLTTGSDGRMIPIVATRGNHESSNTMVYNLFDTPSSDVYYAITFGGDLIRTYTLNTEMSISGNQTTWLANDLAANANVTWKTAQYHKPMRPHVSSKSEGNTQYSSWANLFYDHKVQLVVECDAHTVKTTWPLRPTTGSGSDEGFIRDDVNGTVYAGEGCWGAPLRSNNDNKAWTRNSGMFNQVKWIFVDESKIELRTVRVDNATSVGTVSDHNIFTAPSNLDIWSPSNGSVVSILNTNVSVPEVSLTAPTNGTYYESPQSITLSASASDADGNITAVEFFVNGQSVGTDTSAPYSLNYNLPADGNYSIYAIAKDNDGYATTSESRQVNVGLVQESLSVRIASGNDDVEERTDGSMYMNSSDIELVYDGGNQTVGLRFLSLDIPQGATIDNASIQFTTDETGGANGTLTIYAQDANDASAFSTSNNNVSSRTKTSASVNWSPSSWSSIGQAGSAQRTPELKTLVQEVVNRSGWSSGNDMVFIIEGNGERTAESYDGVSGSAALLNITYTVGGGSTPTPNEYTLSINTSNGSVSKSPNQSTYTEGSTVSLTATPNSGYEFSSWSGAVSGSQNPISITMNSNKTVSANFSAIQTGGTPVTISKSVATGNDDAEEAESGNMYLNSSDLELVYDSHQSAGNQKVGIRFTGLSIPQGVSISDAYIQFTVDETKNDSGNLQIYAQDTNDAAGFSSSSNNISSRTKTSASVSWTPATWSSVGAAGTAQQTPNLSSLVQEVVNRSGWSSGNDMVFIIEGNGRRTAESYNGSSSKAPKLYITYLSNGNARKANISLEATTQFQIFPNPIQEIVNLEFNSEKDGQLQVTFTDMAGRTVLVESLEVKTGLNKIELDVNGLPSGVYVANIVGAGISESVKLTK